MQSDCPDGVQLGALVSAGGSTAQYFDSAQDRMLSAADRF
jgi:hypothetical protein